MAKEENIKNLLTELIEMIDNGSQRSLDRADEIGTSIIKLLEQDPCEMTVEEYRQRMIQAFHNADCDGLIAVCVLPTEKEFEHLEWLLKNHYKHEPCNDAVSRQWLMQCVNEGWINFDTEKDENRFIHLVRDVAPPVKPQQKTGHWREVDVNQYACSNCSHCFSIVPEDNSIEEYKYCPNCKTKMIDSQTERKEA